MKEFPRAQIDQTKQYFEGQYFPVEEVKVGEKMFQYYVIPQKLNSALSDFALRMTHTIPETSTVVGIFGVSDSVPAMLRPYWAMHEIIEFTQIGINKQGRCANAESEVVANLPSELRSEFINRRKIFFEKLYNFFKDDIALGSNNYTNDDLLEAQASLDLLNSISQ